MVEEPRNSVRGAGRPPILLLCKSPPLHADAHGDSLPSGPRRTMDELRLLIRYSYAPSLRSANTFLHFAPIYVILLAARWASRADFMENRANGLDFAV